MKPYWILPLAVGIIIFWAWTFSPKPKQEPTVPEYPEMKIARLADGDAQGFAAIKAEFTRRNPGYDISYVEQTFSIPEKNVHRMAFVQEGGGTATRSNGDQSKISVGDILWLANGEHIKTDSAISYLVFQVPEAPEAELPVFIRPDWDPQITDTPGGCATETGAYRRILLTWLDKVGPYTYHSLNAHRVRIMNSFSHYHPTDIGFDEFYLVQMAMDEAALLTSSRVDLIENPLEVSPEQAQNLIQHTSLKVGDLVYLPRGLMHRGINGVLAQVITVPGFVPGSEIGVDHHLRKINENLNLTGDEALPFNEFASRKAIIK